MWLDLDLVDVQLNKFSSVGIEFHQELKEKKHFQWFSLISPQKSIFSPKVFFFIHKKGIVNSTEIYHTKQPELKSIDNWRRRSILGDFHCFHQTRGYNGTGEDLLGWKMNYTVKVAEDGHKALSHSMWIPSQPCPLPAPVSHVSRNAYYHHV